MEITVNIVLDNNGNPNKEEAAIQFNKKLSKLIKKKHSSGSEGAKNGFKNEDNFINLINNDWKSSEIVESIFNDMGINIKDVETVSAYKPKGLPKTDCCIEISYYLINDKNIHNLSLKLVSSKSKKGYNQIDKRWVSKVKDANGYKEILNIPNDISSLLEFYTGMLPPTKYSITPPNFRDKKRRRLFIDEMVETDQIKLLSWLKTNIDKIFQLVFIGENGAEYPAHFMCVVKNINNIFKYKVFKINDAISFYKGSGNVVVSKRGNIHLGKLTIQRKGGDKGKDTAKQLQIKFDPLDILQ